jgi:hypothetical protein
MVIYIEAKSILRFLYHLNVTILKLIKLPILRKVKLIRLRQSLEHKINMALYPLKIMVRFRFVLSRTSLTSIIFIENAPNYKTSNHFNKMHPFNMS